MKIIGKRHYRQKFEEVRYLPKRDCIEEVSLLSNVEKIRLKKPFAYVARVIFSVLSSNATELSKFGDLAGGTDRFEILYDGDPQHSPVQKLFDFVKVDYDFDTWTDGAAVKQYTFVSRLSYDKFVPPWGLLMQNVHKLEVNILSDIRTMGIEGWLTFEGFAWNKD